MIKAKLLKRDFQEFRSIRADDFPKKEDSTLLDTLILFRHIDDEWFKQMLQDAKIEGIDPVTARRVITASIRRVMEAKKR